MVEIQHKDIVDRMHRDTLIQPAAALPRELGKMIVPTLQVNPVPVFKEITDITANDANKTINVPAGKQWRFKYGHMLYKSSADVGNRTIELRIVDAGNQILWRIRAANTVAASATESFSFAPQGLTAVEDSALFHLIPIPRDCIMAAGFGIRIFDASSIDLDGDDLDIRFMVEESDAPVVN